MCVETTTSLPEKVNTGRSSNKIVTPLFDLQYNLRAFMLPGFAHVASVDNNSTIGKSFLRIVFGLSKHYYRTKKQKGIEFYHCHLPLGSGKTLNRDEHDKLHPMYEYTEPFDIIRYAKHTIYKLYTRWAFMLQISCFYYSLPDFSGKI